MSARQFDRYMIAIGANRHVKFRRLSTAERHAFFLGVLPIAAQAPIRGCLLVGDLNAEPEDVAAEADVSAGVARSAMEKLRKVGMIVPDEAHHCEAVHDFADWNPLPKKDETNAERQRRYRARRNAANNVTSNGNVTADNTDEVEEKELPNGSSSSELAKASPDQVKLCVLLADLVRQRDPKAKPNPQSTAWLAPMRLLLAERDGDAGEVERVLRWSQADPFWQSNILSPKKLRIQFTQLTIKMKAAPLRAVTRPPSPVAEVVAEGDRLIAEALAARSAS